MRRSRPTETYNRLWAMTATGQTATRTERLKCADSGRSPKWGPLRSSTDSGPLRRQDIVSEVPTAVEATGELVGRVSFPTQAGQGDQAICADLPVGNVIQIPSP
jgi:hypothetical protein